jgi:UDP-4-amino-4,6-dideoxy-N-acetyl-beta-L-altrosamine N-acetyltransferase
MLRRIEEKDLEQLRTWRNNPTIYNWCRQNNLISKENQLEWFDRQNSDPALRMFVFGENHAIGVCGLTDIDLINRRAEFSLYIAPEYQKQGFAPLALKELFDYGFYTLGLNVIWGETFDDNPALKLFLRMGLTVEGYRRDFYYKQGKFIGCHLLSLKRAEWDQLSHYKY